MKSRLSIVVALLALVAMPASAAKVYIDYDKQADLEAYETWAYKENAEGKVQDPLMDDRIVSGLRETLAQGKLREVDSSPDLWATYTVTTQERKQYTTTGFGYGGGYGRYGRYGYGSVGISSSQTTEHSYTDGTLIVDIWDARTKELVWRGSATGTLKAKPQKVAKQIDSFYKQMMSKWEKTVAKMKKQQDKQ